MARYKEKDVTDLAWNKVRRQITRDLDTALQNRREEVLNVLLTHAWDEFTNALQKGEVKEIEARYAEFAKTIVEDMLPRDLADAMVHV